jgi:hypothetical protein
LSPLSFIRPLASNAVAFSQLIFDQMLRLPLGVNLCNQVSAFSGFFCASIHPKQSAVSNASAWVNVRIFESFFASRSQTPGTLL